MCGIVVAEDHLAIENPHSGKRMGVCSCVRLQGVECVISEVLCPTNVRLVAVEIEGVL